jgi:hypothetical protein
MALEVFSNEAARPMEVPYITTDKQGRIYLNRLAQKVLNAENMPVSLYVAYDSVNKSIGLVHPDIVRLPNVKPFRFNGDRAYASAIAFLKKNHILPSGAANRYLYVGKEHNGWHLFKLADHLAPDYQYLPQENEVPDGQTSIEDFKEEPAAAIELNDTQQAILNARLENPDKSHRELADLVGRDKSTITKTLKWLRQNNVLKG